VSPFNFTSIGGNLATAPALMGNTIVWKPASSAMLSAFYLMKLYEAAGLPPGVINFVAGDAAMISKVLLSHAISPASTSPAAPRSSTTCGRRSAPHVHLRSYPRIVGETGGRISSSLTRRRTSKRSRSRSCAAGSMPQGQKCSAASRVYVPTSIWNEVRDRASR
jgi:1-pyrroline-5-carboxylate dehydrogenase